MLCVDGWVPTENPRRAHMTFKITGQLEIDHYRGVIYFHADDGYTALRICRLPRPIPKPAPNIMLDITPTCGCIVSWPSEVEPESLDE
jgi:hypothetical protein